MLRRTTLKMKIQQDPHTQYPPPEEKKNQHKFFFWYKRENHAWIRDRLNKAKRPDLVDALLGSKPQRNERSSGQNSAASKQVPEWLSKRRLNGKR